MEVLFASRKHTPLCSKKHVELIPSDYIHLESRQVKRLCYVAEPRDCFNLKGEWVVMAHNLDEAGDVEQFGGSFLTKTEAEAEAERLGRHPTSGARSLA